MRFSARNFFSKAASLFAPAAQNSQPVAVKNSDDDPSRGLERNRFSAREEFQKEVLAEKPEQAKPLPPIPKVELSPEQQQALERMKARMQRNREMDMGR
jgi:hypothetical protein